MKSTYRKWMQLQDHADRTVQTQMSQARRIEECYGDLDEHYDRDQLRGVIDELTYSKADERRDKPNPSQISISGNIRNNLASYKSSTERYCKFRRETADDEIMSSISSLGTEAADEPSQLIGLERDMQAALRRAIGQLEPGLEIIDDGAERSVSSGFIDITARDESGAVVVIELKTGTARQKAVGQVLSYMGDVLDEEPDTEIRGILVAGDFDKKARAAARVVPTLALKAYRVTFEFTDADEAPE